MIRRRNKTHLPLLAAALLAVSAAGCGQDEQTLIDSDRTDRIMGLLDDAEQQFEDGDCDALEGTFENLRQQVTNIDAEVEQEVRTAAVEETERLIDLGSQDCEPAEEVAPPPTIEETIDTDTVPTDTETEETETEETETEEDEGEEDEGENGRGGGSNGGSGGGPPETPPGQENGSVPPPEGGPPEAEVPEDDAQADASEGGA